MKRGRVLMRSENDIIDIKANHTFFLISTRFNRHGLLFLLPIDELISYRYLQNLMYLIYNGISWNGILDILSFQR